MKHIKFLAFLLAMIAGASFFASCGDDDDEGGDNSAVVGHWAAYDYDQHYSNVTLDFSFNGSGTGTIDYYGRSGYTSIHRMTFTYKVKGSKVTIRGTRTSANSDGETTTYSFNINFELMGNTLYVKDGDEWYKNNVSSFRKGY